MLFENSVKNIHKKISIINNITPHFKGLLYTWFHLFNDISVGKI